MARQEQALGELFLLFDMLLANGVFVAPIYLISRFCMLRILYPLFMLCILVSDWQWTVLSACTTTVLSLHTVSQ